MTENERLLERLKGIPVGDHDDGNFGEAKRGRDKAATGPTLADLEIIEYLEFILSHPVTKEPIPVCATLSKRLCVLPVIAQILFSIPSCSSDVERLLSKAGYFVNPRRIIE